MIKPEVPGPVTVEYEYLFPGAATTEIYALSVLEAKVRDRGVGRVGSCWRLRETLFQASL